MPIPTNSMNLPILPEDPEASMTQTASQTVTDQNQPRPDQQDKATVSADTRKLWNEFRQRIDICKSYRRKLISNWTVNIDYRRGKPFASQTDEDTVAVNTDWEMTKTKQAILFSQVPEVRVDHGSDLLPKTAPWVTTFQKKLNDVLKDSGIETTMDEVLPDCINAAGIGIAMVTYESLTEDTEIPAQDPSTPDFDPTQTVSVPRTLDKRYVVQRLSPSDLLFPINFTGADFDNAPWIGRTGRTTWADAVQKFGLQESDKETVLGEDRPMMDKLTHDVEKDKVAADSQVGFDEVFYRDFQYNVNPQSYKTIKRLVYINGKDKPVIDEDWKGQKFDPQTGVLAGAIHFPIQCLTLAYITDETIPPSDSAIIRPQVDEINKGRSQMIRQRERSLPVRWIDINRSDPAISQSLMKGVWQAFIPVQGDGSRIIGEVARATMPQENFTFYKIAKDDASTITGLGPNQVGSGGGIETKGEAELVQQGANTRLTRERARVSSFFVRLAEILGGLLCIYEDPQTLGEGFDPAVSKIFNYSILADATVLLDANQKLARLHDFVEKYGKSGWVNIEPVLQEIAMLSGLDPTAVVRAPQPKPPVEPNISLRLTGVEDLLNPLSLAFMIKSGQAPAPELIEQAKQLIQQAVVPPTPPQDPSMGGLPPGVPITHPTPGAPTPPQTPPPGAPIPPPVPGPPSGAPTLPPQPPKIGEAHPQWTIMPNPVKRSE